MRTIRFKKTGKIIEVENNVAHAFIDRGLAEIYKKNLDEPKKDKMMSLKRNKIRKK